MGRPLPGYDIELIDSEGRAATEGEIAIRLASAADGSHGWLRGRSRDARRELSAGDYYRTSDVAYRDDDGYLWYVGRSDDVFKSSDYRIPPFELESALIEHAAVAEAAFVPSPDPVRLAVPKAFVVLKPGFAPSAEIASSDLASPRRLAPYKRVRRIEFTALPKTISGKIRRVELRALENERRARGERGAHEFWEDEFPDIG